jgi:hypothetical protein
MVNKLKQLTHWVAGKPILSRALHTVWQAVLGYALAQLTAPHASYDTTTLLTGAYAAALSALKTFVVNAIAVRKA